MVSIAFFALSLFSASKEYFFFVKLYPPLFYNFIIFLSPFPFVHPCPESNLKRPPFFKKNWNYIHLFRKLASCFSPVYLQAFVGSFQRWEWEKDRMWLPLGSDGGNEW
jgi:hypothetical protein